MEIKIRIAGIACFIFSVPLPSFHPMNNPIAAQQFRHKQMPKSIMVQEPVQELHTHLLITTASLQYGKMLQITVVLSSSKFPISFSLIFKSTFYNNFLVFYHVTSFSKLMIDF